MLLFIVHAVLFVNSVNIYRENIASTFWLITSLMFDRFSIHLKFWKAQNQGFSTVSTVSTLPVHFDL